jgi:hypothetical protein
MSVVEVELRSVPLGEIHPIRSGHSDAWTSRFRYDASGSTMISEGDVGHEQFPSSDPARYPVFISAVTRELGSARDLGKKGLEDNDFLAVEQKILPPITAT